MRIWPEFSRTLKSSRKNQLFPWISVRRAMMPRSFSMMKTVSVANSPRLAPPVGWLNVTVNQRLKSGVESSSNVMVIDFSISPLANETVPLAAV